MFDSVEGTSLTHSSNPRIEPNKVASKLLFASTGGTGIGIQPSEMNFY